MSDPAGTLAHGTTFTGASYVARAFNIRVTGTLNLVDITDSSTTGKRKFFPDLTGLVVTADLRLVAGHFTAMRAAQVAKTYETIHVTFPDGSVANLSGYVTECAVEAPSPGALIAHVTFTESDPL